jgi:hypothetical protein
MPLWPIRLSLCVVWATFVQGYFCHFSRVEVAAVGGDLHVGIPVGAAGAFLLLYACLVKVGYCYAFLVICASL